MKTSYLFTSKYMVLKVQVSHPQVVLNGEGMYTGMLDKLTKSTTEYNNTLKELTIQKNNL